MRVLGVFYPQGDPASRAYEAQAEAGTGATSNRREGNEVEGHASWRCRSWRWCIVAAALRLLAGTDGERRQGVVGSDAQIACGTTAHDRRRGTDHRAGRVDRPAAAPLGAVLRQALEALKANAKTEDHDRAGRHAARRRHGVRRAGRAVVRVELEGPRRSSARPAARRSSPRRPRYKGGGLALGLRLGDARLAHRRPHRRRNRRGFFFRVGAERRRPGPDGGELHHAASSRRSASTSSTTRRPTRRGSPTASRRT